MFVLQKSAAKAAGMFPLILQLLSVKAFLASVAIIIDTILP